MDALSSGVIPFRRVDGRLEVLLVTSTKNQRWVIPKGRIEPNMTALQSAILEAFEEAGVEGRTEETLLGTYQRRGRTVLVFPMEVVDVLNTWPEQNLRARRWFPIDQAITEVEEHSLKAILQGLARQR